MAKTEKTKPFDEPESETADAQDAIEAGQGLVKKVLGNKKLLVMAAGGALVVVLALASGTYFVFFGGSAPAATQASEGTAQAIAPPQVAFFDMPDIIVNIQTADGSPAYLKVGIALELSSASERAGLQALKPRLVDQFQGYLRELRVDDLRGSAGVLRLKEELLRRVNLAAAPYQVKDVLLKEMLVQ